MMEYLFPCSVAFLLGAVAGVVSVIRSAACSDDGEAVADDTDGHESLARTDDVEWTGTPADRDWGNG